MDVDLQTPAKQCVDKGISACHVPISFSPGSLPGKRIHAEISKKIPQTEKAIPTKSYLTRLVEPRIFVAIGVLICIES